MSKARNTSMLINGGSGNYIGFGTETPSQPLDIVFSGDHGTRIKSTDSHSSLYLDSSSSGGQYIRMSTNGTDNYWINATNSGELDFRPDGGSYSVRFGNDRSVYMSGGETRYEFYRYGSGTAYTRHHIKTTIPWAGHTQMYSLEFKGHEYGSSKSIDARIVWYSYSASGQPISVGNDGTHTINLYRSSDGYVVIRIYFASGYYAAWSLSQFTTNQGLNPITVSGVTGSSSDTVY